MTTGLTQPQSTNWSARLADYLSLTKPAIVALLLLTTLCGMVIAIGGLPPLATVGLTLLGGGLTAGGAGALNQYIDRGIDRRMVRTMGRALPDQRLRPVEGLLFGLAMCVAGLAVLLFGVNPLSAILALAGIIYYAVLYSVLLKPSTPQNIVVGGGAGAIPPLVGWAAATGSLSLPAFFLFAVIFFWTPAPLLGPSPAQAVRLRTGRNSDAAGCLRRGGDPSTDSAVQFAAGRSDGPAPVGGVGRRAVSGRCAAARDWVGAPRLDLAEARWESIRLENVSLFEPVFGRDLFGAGDRRTAHRVT